MTLKRDKPDPRPVLWDALRVQFWTTVEEVSVETGVPTGEARRWLKRWASEGKADRMLDAGGRHIYRKRQGSERWD